MLGFRTDQRVAECCTGDDDMPSLGIHQVDDFAIRHRVIDDGADMFGGVVGGEAHRTRHVLDSQLDIHCCSCR